MIHLKIMSFDCLAIFFPSCFLFPCKFCLQMLVEVSIYKYLFQTMEKFLFTFSNRQFSQQIPKSASYGDRQNHCSLFSEERKEGNACAIRPKKAWRYEDILRNDALERTQVYSIRAEKRNEDNENEEKDISASKMKVNHAKIAEQKGRPKRMHRNIKTPLSCIAKSVQDSRVMLSKEISGDKKQEEIFRSPFEKQQSSQDKKSSLTLKNGPKIHFPKSSKLPKVFRIRCTSQENVKSFQSTKVHACISPSQFSSKQSSIFTDKENNSEVCQFLNKMAESQNTHDKKGRKLMKRTKLEAFNPNCMESPYFKRTIQ